MLRNEKKSSERDLRRIRSRLKDQNENSITTKTYYAPQTYYPTQRDRDQNGSPNQNFSDFAGEKNLTGLGQRKAKNPLRDITNSEPENGENDIKSITNLITQNISNILLDHKFEGLAGTKNFGPQNRKGEIFDGGRLEGAAINFVEKNKKVLADLQANHGKEWLGNSDRGNNFYTTPVNSKKQGVASIISANLNNIHKEGMLLRTESQFSQILTPSSPRTQNAKKTAENSNWNLKLTKDNEIFDKISSKLDLIISKNMNNTHQNIIKNSCTNILDYSTANISGQQNFLGHARASSGLLLTNPESATNITNEVTLNTGRTTP